MGIAIDTTIKFKIEECYSCGVKFGIPLQLQENLRNNHNTFYCPNGHNQAYMAKSEAEKLRDELKRKEQELADEVKRKLQIMQQRDIAFGEKNQLERKLKRVHNGICPCCKRSFQNLKNHMKTKHPELLKP